MGRLTKKITNKNEVIEEIEVKEERNSTNVGARLIVAIIIVFLIVSLAFYGLAL